MFVLVFFFIDSLFFRFRVSFFEKYWNVVQTLMSTVFTLKQNHKTFAWCECMNVYEWWVCLCVRVLYMGVTVHNNVPKWYLAFTIKNKEN